MLKSSSNIYLRPHNLGNPALRRQRARRGVRLLLLCQPNVNYPGLRKLYEKYHGEGFSLLGFPCNQFGGQAPGTSEEEREYAYKKFGISFPIMDKINVNGKHAHPLYRFLKERLPESVNSQLTRPGDKGPKIEWNYVKFLVGRDGQPVCRYGSAFDPLKFESQVQELLAGKDAKLINCNVSRVIEE
ncbi:hypothetical protein WJX73_007945 [Symbiochloris irregularis]|uniref:Glutathione peroxidase n=1 Tax=Symbiochloris irregularis TaxID=706552 RepID=A0AAW1NZL0_9CHLO